MSMLHGFVLGQLMSQFPSGVELTPAVELVELMSMPPPARVMLALAPVTRAFAVALRSSAMIA